MRNVQEGLKQRLHTLLFMCVWHVMHSISALHVTYITRRGVELHVVKSKKETVPQ